MESTNEYWAIGEIWKARRRVVEQLNYGPKEQAAKEQLDRIEAYLNTFETIMPESCPKCGSHDFADGGRGRSVSCRRCDWSTSVQ